MKTWIGLLMLLVSLTLYSQSGTAVIVYAEGDGFTLVRDNETSFYEVTYDDVLGMLLYPGDTILTEEDTFLEIQVTSNASLIKIAENTTFAFEAIGQFGGGTLSVAYGRLRAKVNKLTNNDEFSVIGSGTTAGVRGTDFGYDLTFGEEVSESQSNEAITTVYCFEGAVKVEQKNAETDQVQEVLVSADQMVVTSSIETEAPLVVYEIEEEIDTFWEENKFVYELVDQDTPVVVVVEEYTDEDYYTDKIFMQKRREQLTGGALGLGGAIAAVGGFIVYTQTDVQNAGIVMMGAGGAAFATGIIYLIHSLTLPPYPEGWTPPTQPVP